MTKPLVSLLMPAYNSAKFIKYAVDSVRNQTYENWELIIVDDCSNDGTWEVAYMLSTYDTRIKAYKNDKNLGIVKNRKKTYLFSSGDLIGHLDNDDILERYALDEMVRAFDQLPKIGLIYSDLAQIDENGKHQLYSASHNYNSNILHQHGWRHFGMYQRSVMDHIDGYNDKLISACEDGDLFMQIAEKYAIVRLPKVLYLYRSHLSNNSHNNKECKSCEERLVCNYARVWCKSANYDIITFKPIDIQMEVNNL